MGRLLFHLLDVAYKIVAGRAVLYLYGRTPEGRQVCVRDAAFEPYFYVLPKDADISNELAAVKLEKGQVVRVERVKRNHNEKEVAVLKVVADLPNNVPALRDHIAGLPGVKEVLEADILFVRRYLIDKQLTPLTLIEAECESSTDESRVAVFDATLIKQSSDDTLTQPRVLAIDIEVYNPLGKRVLPEQHPILMLSLYGDGLKKVLTWKRVTHAQTDIEAVDSEATLLQRAKELIIEHKPDILVGYYSDGFDLPYIKARADKYRIKLDLGWDLSEMRMSGRENQTMQFTGLVHVDVLRFIRQVMGRSMETDVFTLDAVAGELLGAHKAKVEIEKLAEFWDGDDPVLGEFASYNLHDARLTHDLLIKILPNMIEMVKIVGLPLWDVTRMTFSQLVEWFIMRQAFVANELIPNKPGFNERQRREMKRFKGAFVFEPTPGLYEDLAVFDYRSLYPSIIASHNISPGTLNCPCCEGKDVVPDSDVTMWYCTKRRGFISRIIEDIISRRARIKELLRKKKDPLLAARSESLKVLANSFYGYLGFAPARWYCFECGQSVTAWGRHHIHDVIAKAKAAGFGVAYSDSLPGDRKVFIRTEEGDVRLARLDELGGEDEGRTETLTYTPDHRVRFMPINRVIRHATKPGTVLLHIDTKYGTTVVTGDHSVYAYQEGIRLVKADGLREGDFLLSLTRPDIKVTYRDGHVFDLATMEMGEYESELCLYSDRRQFPTMKGICPYCGKEASLSSHVSSKHKDRRQPLDKSSPLAYVGTMDANGGRIPRHWTLDEDLAWLLGFYCAEGSLSDGMTKTGRKCMVSFGGQDLALIEKACGILQTKIGVRINIIEDFDKRIGKKMHYCRLQYAPIVPLFQYGFGCGKGSTGKKVPSFMFSAEEPLRRSFLQGYLDGDGQKGKDKRYATKFERFSTKSGELAIGLQFLFKTLDNGKNKAGKDIRHVAWQYRRDKPGVVTLRVQSAKHARENYCLAEIRGIRRVPLPDHVYDLEVAGSHNFVDAEGLLLVHNTDSCFLQLKGKSHDEAMSFLESVNRDLPGLMEMELEAFYPAGLFVAAKTSEAGAKKRYALIDENDKLKIRGFEMVRRNVSPIAKRTQEEVLRIILSEKDPRKAQEYVQGVVKRLQANEVPIADITITTALTREIGGYESVGPHVAAAQRMKNRGIDVGQGTRVVYVVTKGKGKIRDKVRLPDEVKQQDYDGEYYVDHQVLPAVERILAVVGVDIAKATAPKTQSTLGSF